MKILIADKLENSAIDILRINGFEVDVKTGLSEDEIAAIITDYDGLLVRSGVKVTKKIIDAAGRLKVIGRAGVGVDNIDVASATDRGVVVMNTPLGNVNAAAEHTIAMILALSRHIHKAHNSMQKGLWERKKFEGNELRGKAVGIIGVGNVGRIVARILQGFNAAVYGYDPFLTETAAKELGIRLVDLDFIIRNSDFISLHVPLNEKTRNMLGKKEFETMKKGVRIINVGRGGLVNEEDLYNALKEGKVAGAAIDVWESEPPKDYRLAELDNVLATPHLGASTEEAQKSVAIDIARQVSDFLLNGIVSGAVNLRSLKPEDYKALSPYMGLAEKLGRIVIQLADGGLERVEIQYRGKIAEYETSALTPYVIKGILQHICGSSANEVNSMTLAKNRNIKVVESKSVDTENYANLIRVIVTTDKGSCKANGTMFDDRKERIVKINDFDIDMEPRGNMVLTHNLDVPGVIGQIGTIMGSSSINIARMAVGRNSAAGGALNVTIVDSDVNEDVLQRLRNAKNVTSVRIVRL
ncbi:phosphoglycerate dehydrogenase [Candidatus Woesearchaeota archaeon]|nr:phosphoglycerate dehydrogenase [Candidatus Woesearchaeota archaeon]